MKLNKLFFTLLLSILFIGFSSCSDDDDDNNKGIAGTWSLSKVEAEAAASSNLNEIKEQLKNEDFFPKIIFFENNTFKTVYLEEEDNDEGTYTFKDNILTLYWYGDQEEWDAYKTTVSGNTLKIEDDNTEDYKKYDFPDSGVTKAISVFYFTRQ